MNLVIVESPTKARTISRFLGKEYKIESSYGHVRDLPKSKMGIDVEKNFEPHYIIPLKSRKNVTALKKLALKSSKIILATDEDREGEAIAWHIAQILNADKTPVLERIVFHEITESAIKDALKNPRQLDLSLVDAQQARRILDRLVGYLLSPFLWKKIIRGLSAGRVQSVALKLIVERENEIKAFKPEEYWTISVLLKNDAGSQIWADLYKINGQVLDKFAFKNKDDVQKIEKILKYCDFNVKSIQTKSLRRNPPTPFITSTLQQESSKRLRYSSKQTMRIAQGLYEKGLITYMRTDSVNLSQESLAAASEWIKKELGKNYLLDSPRIFKTKSRLAQEAHEAIRPTNPYLAPKIFGGDAIFEDRNEERLYDLIWRRFMASQLPQAIFNSTGVDILTTPDPNSENNSQYWLKTNGNTLTFDGFLKIWPQKFEEKEIPELKENDTLKPIEINTDQHFTEPPPRYNEASLIKTLEEFGIGRPSTYAPTISVIQARNYVQKNQDRRFEPTEIGGLVNKVLTENFPEIVDINFTARMENDLDEIADGEKKWQSVIKEFYEPFAKNLEQKYQNVTKEDFVKEEKTDEICEKCSKPMIIKTGRFGKFLACSSFPECKNTKSLKREQGGTLKSFGKCPKCNDGEVVMKRTKKFRFFYGCNRYPECDYASWKKPELISNTT